MFQLLMALTLLAQFTPEQKVEVQTIIREYLISNPEVLIEASQSLQKKQLEQIQGTARLAIGKNLKTLFDGNSPTLGNPKGTVTLVEFLDYQCGHCKTLHKAIKSQLKENSNLRYVVKFFPVFGQTSEFASLAALASQEQGKFLLMHNALMEEPGQLTNERVLEIATSVGLNAVQLKRDMGKFEQQLMNEKTLANLLGLKGTPGLLLAPNPVKDADQTLFIPGAVPEKDLAEAIKKAQSL